MKLTYIHAPLGAIAVKYSFKTQAFAPEDAHQCSEGIHNCHPAGAWKKNGKIMHRRYRDQYNLQTYKETFSKISSNALLMNDFEQY